MRRRLFLLVIVIIVLAGSTVWWWTRQSLPSLDGEVRVAGLAAPVEVLIDPHGVPHVYAGGAEDAWFAAGVLHARDRLWQMDLYRRAASGRLSELLGRDALRIDKRFITLGLREAAEAEWQTASPAVRAALTRYADGVNAHMALASGRFRPLEFQLLRVMPAQWTPMDSLLIARLMAWRMAENHQAEIVRHALAAKFGESEAARLAGRYPTDGPAILDAAPAPPTTSTAGSTPPSTPSIPSIPSVPSPSAPSHPSRAFDPTPWLAGLEWLRPSARKGNSNSWVVAGRRTASGRPMLANDPHLQVEFPGLWYEMHLVAAELDVMGVTIPGAPFVVIGHNQRIAWGLTNTGADVQDLSIERVDVARRRYLADGQWVPVDVQKVAIPIRGGGVEEFEAWRTRHGPIFAEVGFHWEDAPDWLSVNAERTSERRAFALRWDVGRGETMGAFEALNRAGDWASFTAAVERLAAPSQNFVYADVDGNIGYVMSGLLPQRSSGNGTFPREGSLSGGEWVGRVGGSQLPRQLNPARGFVASANNPVDRRASLTITQDWPLPYRARRLNEALGPAERLDLTAAAALQNDVLSLAAADILALVPSALAAGRKRNADAAGLDMLQQLGAWDRRVDDRPIVLAYQLFEAALWRRTFVDEMDEGLFQAFYKWAGAERPAGIYMLLDEPASRWFDDLATIEQRESRDDIYVLAAADAALQMNGPPYNGRRWSDLHTASFTHPIANAGRPLAWLFSREAVGVVGDGTTVMRTSYDRAQPFGVWEAPSWRQIFDVGDWDASRVVSPAGQSGHPLSPHYFDQNEIWRQGQYRPQPFTRSAVDAARRHRLLLLP